MPLWIDLDRHRNNHPLARPTPPSTVQRAPRALNSIVGIFLDRFLASPIVFARRASVSARDRRRRQRSKVPRKHRIASRRVASSSSRVPEVGLGHVANFVFATGGGGFDDAHGRAHGAWMRWCECVRGSDVAAAPRPRDVYAGFWWRARWRSGRARDGTAAVWWSATPRRRGRGRGRRGRRGRSCARVVRCDAVSASLGVVSRG